MLVNVLLLNRFSSIRDLNQRERKRESKLEGGRERERESEANMCRVTISSSILTFGSLTFRRNSLTNKRNIIII
jgi:hypothetical protein